MSYVWNLELVRKRDGCQFMCMLNTWVSKGVWHYSSGMLWQDVTLFSVSIVGRKTACNVLEAFPEITDVFARLSLGFADITDDDLTLVERLFCFTTKLAQLPLLMMHTI